MVWRLAISSVKTSCAIGALALLFGAAPAVTQTTEPDVQAQLHPYVPPASASSASVEASPTASAASSSSQSHTAPRPRPKPSMPVPRPAPPVTASVGSSSSQTSGLPAGPVPYVAAGSSVAPPVIHIAPKPVKPAAPVNAGPGAVPVSVPISAGDIETFTDSVVRTLMQRDHVLGVEVAVVQGDTPLLVKGYGYDRLKPARRVDATSSLFRLGSISKVFTWVVARQEIEAGRIKPNVSIGDYLPADIYTEDRRFKPITLNDLMDHTPGYEDTSLGHLFNLDGAQLEGVDSYFRIHRPRRVRQPGEFSSYSNFGVALAARALAQTARGKDVPSLMEARVFSPLGMAHTTLREPYQPNDLNAYDLPAPLAPGLAQDLSEGFVWDGATYAAQPFDHALPLSGALGASSTAQDMAAFMSMMLGSGQYGGVQLFNADSARAFRTPMLKVPSGYNGWASGLMTREAPSGEITYGHGGATLWFNANMVLVPSLNLGVFIAANTQTGGPLTQSFPNLLLDHLSGDLVRPPLMPAPDMAYADHRDYYRAISGQYVSTRRAYGGLEGAVTRLLNTVSISADRDGRLILATANGLSAFVPASAPGFFLQQDAEDPGPAAETGGLHFLLPANGGKAKAFETASNLARYERVGWLHSPQTLGWLSAIAVVVSLLTLLSLARPRQRHEQPTQAQVWATIVSVGMAVLWLLALFIFHSWREGLADNPGALFTRWPSGSVRLASSLAFLAALAALYQAGSLYFVLSDEARYGEGWTAWQKATHAALVAWSAFYAVVLMLWGALEPWSW
jgi:CubicO group peptidase (beta-lactamase class C family)